MNRYKYPTFKRPKIFGHKFDVGEKVIIHKHTDIIWTVYEITKKGKYHLLGTNESPLAPEEWYDWDESQISGWVNEPL